MFCLINLNITESISLGYGHCFVEFERFIWTLAISKAPAPGVRDTSDVQTVLSIDQTRLQKGLLPIPLLRERSNTVLDATISERDRN